MEELKSMKQQLMAAAQAQMGNLENVDAKELGEVIDMIKDLEEAIYYCSIVKAMDESKEEKKDSKKYDEIMTSLLARSNEIGGNQEQRYYTPYFPMWDDPRHGDDAYMIRKDNPSRVRYYDGGNPSQGSQGMGQMSRDSREGRSGQARRGYMEGKEQHQGKEKQIQELDNYIRELSSDITDMIKDATPEERTLLQQKLSTLADKVVYA